MDKSNDIKYKLKGIELLHAILNEPIKPLKEEIKFQFEVNVQHKLNVEKELLFVVCNIKIFDEIIDELFGSVTSSCIFEIQELSTLLGEEFNIKKLPEQLIVSLNSISISTTRGILFSHFRGTFLHNAILPIVHALGFKEMK
jgi:hypothetical protein